MGLLNTFIMSHEYFSLLNNMILYEGISQLRNPPTYGVSELGNALSIDQFIIEDAMGAALIGTLFPLLARGIFGMRGGYLGRTLKERR